MVGATHFYKDLFVDPFVSSGKAVTFLVIALVLIALMEINALGLLGGKAQGNKLLWPYESHKNAIITAFVFWAVLWIVSEILFN